jgi:hypothetical protein
MNVISVTGFFIHGFPKLIRFQVHHDKVLKKFLPKLKKHFDKQGVDSGIYTLKWFFQCFLDRVRKMILFLTQTLLYPLVLSHRINVPSSGKVKRIRSEYKITVGLWCIFDFFPGKNINVLILLCITIVCVGKNSFHSDLNFEFENVFVVLMNAVIA